MGDEILYPLKGSLSPIFTSLTCSGPSNGSREGSPDVKSLLANQSSDGSMEMVYLPTFSWFFKGKCR